MQTHFGYTAINWGSPFVHSGWMNSLGHRTNILAPEYTLLGVGIVGGSGYSLTYTENFYTPR